MGFDISRLRRADQIVGGGAIALFIFMFFFKWFGGSVTGALPSGDVSAASASSTGWDTFTNSRWIWLITIIVALVSVVMVAAERKVDWPIGIGVIVTALGGLSTLLILYRIIHHPSNSVSFAGLHASYGIKIGIWLGLIAAAAITYGGYLQMQQEGSTSSASDGEGGAAFSGVTVAGSSAGSAGTDTPPTPPSTTPPTTPEPSPTPPPATPPGPPPTPPPTGPPGPTSGGETPPTQPGA